MAKKRGGLSKPVRVISDSDLIQNGGAFAVVGRTAMPVASLGTLRKVVGGQALYVYPVTQAQIDSGEYGIGGGIAEPVADVDDIGYTRGFVGAKRAIPVFVREGVLGGYLAKLLNIEPADNIALWPLTETMGGVADNAQGISARDGAYTGVSLNNILGPDGKPAGLWDGANDFCNVYSPSINTVWDGAELTLHIWAKMLNSGVWTDTTFRTLFDFRTADADYINIRKSNTINDIDFQRRAGAGIDSNIDGVDVNAIAGTDWFSLTVTISETEDEMMAYVNGSQVGSTLTGLGAWSGALTSTQCTIGSFTLNPNSVHSGYLAYAVVWTKVLSTAQILAAATI